MKKLPRKNKDKIETIKNNTTLAHEMQQAIDNNKRWGLLAADGGLRDVFDEHLNYLFGRGGTGRPMDAFHKQLAESVADFHRKPEAPENQEFKGRIL